VLLNSGNTIGAIIEAAIQGVSVSRCRSLGLRQQGPDDPFEAAAKHGAATVRALLTGIWTTDAYRNHFTTSISTRCGS
jgi:5'-nucleotidase